MGIYRKIDKAVRMYVSSHLSVVERLNHSFVSSVAPDTSWLASSDG